MPKIVAVSIENYPCFRECTFCLCLQEGSIFADFHVDGEGLVVLRRISFDGYGCCEDAFSKMNRDHSRALVDSVQRDSVGRTEIHEILVHYFEENSERIWIDALASYGFV